MNRNNLKRILLMVGFCFSFLPVSLIGAAQPLPTDIDSTADIILNLLKQRLVGDAFKRMKLLEQARGIEGLECLASRFALNPRTRRPDDFYESKFYKLLTEELKTLNQERENAIERLVAQSDLQARRTGTRLYTLKDYENFLKDQQWGPSPIKTEVAHVQNEVRKQIEQQRPGSPGPTTEQQPHPIPGPSILSLTEAEKQYDTVLGSLNITAEQALKRVALPKSGVISGKKTVSRSN